MKPYTFTKLTLIALTSLLLLTLLPASFAAQSAITFREAFPDEVFRENVVMRVLGYSSNYNGVISDADKEKMSETTSLTISLGYNTNLQATSLEGLEYFGALTSLSVHGNGKPLQEIDLSANSNLTTLYILTCIINTIDLSNNPALTTLVLSGNELTSLDISNNPNLTHLDVSANELTSLDVSNNPKLDYLGVHYNRLTEIDTSKNRDLAYLFVSDNNLTKLDASHHQAMIYIKANNNQLTNIALPNSQKLYYLEIQNNKLTSVDTSTLPNLTNFYANDNELTKADFSSNASLRCIFIENNRLEELAIVNNPNFETLVCYNNNMGDAPDQSVPGWRQNPYWPEAVTMDTQAQRNDMHPFIYYPQSPRSPTNPGTASPTTPENPGTASPTTPENPATPTNPQDPTAPILQNLIDALPQNPSATEIQTVLTTFPDKAQLIADPQNQAPLKYLENLYAQATRATLQPKIAKNTHGNFHKTESEVSALGALFNAPENGGTLYLNFTAPAKNAQIDATLYKKNEAVQVDIKLLDSNGNELTLKFPIAITIRIPSGISDENFVILHYKSGIQTPEVIRPKLNGDGTCTFIVNSFSVFVFTNALSGELIVEGELGVERERERPEKPAPIVPVLYDIAKSGDTFSFKAIIANASGSMVGSKIYVTLNERYSAFATLGQDAVAIGTLDAPGFSGTIANFAARVVGVHAPAVTKPMLVTSKGNVVARD